MVTLALVLTLAGCAGGPASTAPTGSSPARSTTTSKGSQPTGHTARGVFFAFYYPLFSQKAALEEFSDRTGRPLRAVYRPRPRHSPFSTLSAPQETSTGQLIFAISSGPKLREPQIMGGDPEPRTCHGKVVSLDPATGVVTVLLRTPRNVWLGNATPDATGDELILTEAPCARSFDNSHFVLVDLAAHLSRQLATGAAVCHDLRDPSFEPGGRAIVFSYGRARRPSPAAPAGREGYGFCESSRPDEMAVLPLTGSGTTRIDRARLFAATPRCAYQEVVPDRTGVAAISECAGAGGGGGGGIELGPTSIVQIVPDKDGYHVTGSWALPTNGDGVTLSEGPTGKVLVDEYQAPIYEGTRTVHNDMQYLEVFTGHSLRLIRTAPGDEITDGTW